MVIFYATFISTYVFEWNCWKSTSTSSHLSLYFPTHQVQDPFTKNLTPLYLIHQILLNHYNLLVDMLHIYCEDHGGQVLKIIIHVKIILIV